MGNDRKMIKEHLLKSFKIAVAALLSIFIAGELGLEYSATAGIITVLSIGRTKRETFRSAANRGMAYICALALAFVCFRLLGYTLPAFGLYLFLFAFLCVPLFLRDVHQNYLADHLHPVFENSILNFGKT